MKIIKLHIGLYKYLKIEIKKLKTIKESILFFNNIFQQYFLELIKIYKSMFLILDRDYRKQQKEIRNYKKLKKQLLQCIKILNYLDNNMTKSGMTR